MVSNHLYHLGQEPCNQRVHTVDHLFQHGTQELKYRSPPWLFREQTLAICERSNRITDDNKLAEIKQDKSPFPENQCLSAHLYPGFSPDSFQKLVKKFRSASWRPNFP